MGSSYGGFSNFFLFLALCFTLPNLVLGQNNLNLFKHISTSDKFSLSPVTAIGQDSRGLMWFGTRNGLIRYDGIQLKFFKRQLPGKSNSSANDIFDIHLDREDRVWMATSFGLSVYDPRKDAIENFPTLGSGENTTSSPAITCLQEMATGEIWIGTRNGLNIFNPKTATFKHIFHQPQDAKSISSNFITCLFQAKDETIWVGTNNGLNRLSSKSPAGKYEFELYQHNSGQKNSLVSNQVNVLSEDQSGNLWIGTNEGLDYFKVKRGEFVHYNQEKDNFLTSNLVRAMAKDQMGRLWVGTYDGINVIDSTFSVVHIKHAPTLPSSLVDNKIRALFTDRNGSVWVGSYYGGINYWDERLPNFSKIDEGDGNKLSYNVISAIEQDQEGNVYFGTEGEGVCILNAQTNKYAYINQLPGNLKIGSVKSLMLNGTHNLLIGTFNDGLICLNTKTNHFKQYKNKPQDKTSVSSDRVVSIEKAEGGKFWIGTLSGGLNLFDPEDETFFQIQTAPKNEKSLLGNSVRVLHLDKKGNLFVGTTMGLSVLKKKNTDESAYLFERLTVSTNDALALDIQDVFEDSTGQVWVGTLDLGLYLVKENKLVPCAIKGVTSVFSIVQSGEYLWLSSNEGIVRYHPQQEEHKVYDFREGVKPNEFSRSSKLLAKNGTVYFGGASGVTSFSPDHLGGINAYAPKVVITDFKILDKTLSVGDSTGILRESILGTDRITLNYDQNIFTVNFAMPNFVKGDNDKYMYRLLGLDEKWITTAVPVVTFIVQQGGDYVFQVKGENGDGFQTGEVTSLKINLLQPPWKTWWAYSIYGAIIFGVLFIMVYFFLARLKLQHKLDLETREFLHQQEVNKQKFQFFTNISHEFRTPLTLISGPLQKLISDYKGPHKVFDQLLVIKRNTDQLFKLINELMDFRKFENNQMRLQASEGNIVKFLKDIYLTFKQQAHLHQYAFTFESQAEEINVFFDPDQLEKVFYNLLANAFKYTPQHGSIALKITCTDSQVRIAVQDSGNGMKADQLEKIFDSFYEAPDQKAYGKFTQGTGLGLAIAKSGVELHQGQLTVASTEGKGSAFTVILPLGSAHLQADEVTKERDRPAPVSQQPQAREDFGRYPEKEYASPKGEGKKSVLVVEDNTEVGNFIRSVLCDFYQVTLVENGSLAYISAIADQPDLIISDVMMPVMDGNEFCTKVKSDIRTSHIPFILLSARTSLGDKFGGLESGADEYLYKPFEVKELLLKCKNILHTHDRLKEKFSRTGVIMPSEIPGNSLDETMMTKAFQLVKEHISDEFFDVQLFCEELGISRSLLFTKFKAWTNQTPNEFILGMRMKEAAALIEQNKHNISEIGYKVGFKDPNYFSKAFKKYHSLSPKAYSEKFRESLHVE
jgi:signal transduction histidine kinase/ligand-binding sensor domain-containing protein/AraC-like DNA-binding protein